ncbi:MAG: DUF1566 domain-containing protein [Proteobacteria bacterium]|nr:DUF1566 domain-containing protein [Pseudomonadota bacterium]
MVSIVSIGSLTLVSCKSACIGGQGYNCSDDDDDDTSPSTDTSYCYEPSSTVATTTSTTGNYVVVDTDQTTCFDSSLGSTTTCTGTSDSDTAYDADFTGNQPSYSLNGDGTVVTDNNTDLMWAQSTDTNDDGSVNDSDKMTMADGVSYCENLSLGGYDDWRLPDIKTLYSLITFNGGDPSSYDETDTSILTPFIHSAFDWAFGDQNAGERLIDGQYLTSTRNENQVFSDTNPGDAFFGVNFVDGRIKSYECNGAERTYYVRCVRGNTDYGLNNLSSTDSGATVSDSATGLMWQQSDTQSTDWDNAVDTCKNATTASNSDWRLPNAKELQSIVDYTRSPDTTGSAAIDSVFASTSFANEEGATEWPWYWASTTHKTYLNVGKSGAYVTFGRALGYFQNAVQDVHGAGAQRSNYKLDVSSTPGANAYDTFYYHGPQGDILRLGNYVRCVRDI